MTTRRPPASQSKSARIHSGARRGPHHPQCPARLKRAFEDDDDSFDVPETALGGAKD